MNHPANLESAHFCIVDHGNPIETSDKVSFGESLFWEPRIRPHTRTHMYEHVENESQMCYPLDLVGLPQRSIQDL